MRKVDGPKMSIGIIIIIFYYSLYEMGSHELFPKTKRIIYVMHQKGSCFRGKLVRSFHKMQNAVHTCTHYKDFNDIPILIAAPSLRSI